MKRTTMLLVIAAMLLAAPSAQAGDLALEANGGFFYLNVDFEVLENIVTSSIPGVDVALEYDTEKPVAPYYGLGLIYGLMPSVDVGVHAAYWKGTVSNSGTVDDPFGFLGQITFTSEVTTTIIPVLCQLTLKAPTYGSLRPYLRLGAGMASVKIDIASSAMGVALPINVSTSMTEIGLGAVGGVSAKLGPSMTAFAEGGYFYTGAEYVNSQLEKQYITGFLGTAGLRIPL